MGPIRLVGMVIVFSIFLTALTEKKCLAVKHFLARLTQAYAFCHLLRLAARRRDFSGVLSREHLEVTIPPCYLRPTQELFIPAPFDN